jgi:hypothetical protein
MNGMQAFDRIIDLGRGVYRVAALAPNAVN